MLSFTLSVNKTFFSFEWRCLQILTNISNHNNIQDFKNLLPRYGKTTPLFFI